MSSALAAPAPTPAPTPLPGAELLFQAVWEDDPRAVAAALQALAGADLASLRARSGATPLCHAVHRAQPNARAIISLLLTAAPHLVRVPYNSARFAGETALHLAIADGDGELVAQLLEADAALGQDTPPPYAALPRLVASEAVGSFFAPPRATYFGGLPLSFAIAEGRFELALALVAAGARLEAQDSRGNTALHVAVMKRVVAPLLAWLPRLCAAQEAACGSEGVGGGGRGVSIGRLLAVTNADGYHPLALAASDPAYAPAFDELWHRSGIALWRWGGVSASLLPLKEVDPLAGRLEAAWVAAGRRSGWHKVPPPLPSSRQLGAGAGAGAGAQQSVQRRRGRARSASAASLPLATTAALAPASSLRSPTDQREVKLQAQWRHQHTRSGGEAAWAGASPRPPSPPASSLFVPSASNADNDEEESQLQEAASRPLSVLEVAVRCGNGDVLAVPALERLLGAKWQAYGGSVFRRRCWELGGVACAWGVAVAGRVWGASTPPALCAASQAAHVTLAIAAVLFLHRATGAAAALAAAEQRWQGHAARRGWYRLLPLADVLGVCAAVLTLAALAVEGGGSITVSAAAAVTPALAASALLFSFHALSYVALLSPDTSSLVMTVFVVWRDFLRWGWTAGVLGGGFTLAMALAEGGGGGNCNGSVAGDAALPAWLSLASSAVSSALRFPLAVASFFTGEDWVAVPTTTPPPASSLDDGASGVLPSTVTWLQLALRCCLALLGFVTLSTLQAQMNATFEGTQAAAKRLWLLALARRLLVVDATLSPEAAAAAVAAYAEEHDPASTGYWRTYLNFESESGHRGGGGKEGEA